ncbi:MAG: heme ABC exporter ATP-binding protein CcmA [Alphaproteobacteria bacterium]|nr:MAG: heme ABC exporter ATP-binding protein CcmA [Alphaproteobacteria bacterium]
MLENIACIRGGRMLFQNLSCGLAAGDVLHLSGPNGSGKTSLLRIMAGALPAAAGKILWGGSDFLKNGPEEHAGRIAFLPSDDRNLKILETANENIRFWAQLGGDTTRCADVLSRMNLSRLAHTPVQRLSAGQRRRLSIARILLNDRPLWLLDEPFNGLDAASMTLFRDILDAHVAQGGMAVIASHHALKPPKSGALRHVELGAVA